MEDTLIGLVVIRLIRLSTRQVATTPLHRLYDPGGGQTHDVGAAMQSSMIVRVITVGHGTKQIPGDTRYNYSLQRRHSEGAILTRASRADGRLASPRLNWFSGIDGGMSPRGGFA